jgi:hypothetical protein
MAGSPVRRQKGKLIVINEALGDRQEILLTR